MPMPPIPPTPITNKTRKPRITVPTVTLHHNASIPSTDGYVTLNVNFGVQARFFGTSLDSVIDYTFWNWTSGFHLMRRSGVGEDTITLDNQTITTQKAVRVMPVGSAEGILVADIGGSGASHSYFTTTTGDRFPVYDFPAASIATFPQLRAASANNFLFQANFGSGFTVGKVTGGEQRLTVYSTTGKVIQVQNGSANALLYLDGSNNLCQGSGSDITVKTASLLSSLSPDGMARFQVYINENNGSHEYLEHDFLFVPNDIQVPFEATNNCITVKYNANAASEGVPARWSASNSRMEADMVGNANLTLKASIVEQPNQQINGQ